MNLRILVKVTFSIIAHNKALQHNGENKHKGENESMCGGSPLISLMSGRLHRVALFSTLVLPSLNRSFFIVLMLFFLFHLVVGEIHRVEM